MLGREVVEGEQDLAVFGQAVGGVRVLARELLDEEVEGGFGGGAGVTEPAKWRCGSTTCGIQRIPCCSPKECNRAS